MRALLLLVILASSLAAESKNFVFVAGEPSHGYAAHEHRAGVMLLERLLKQAVPGVGTQVFDQRWPSQESLAAADALVIITDGHNHIALPYLDQVTKRAAEGMGVMLVHYAVDRPSGAGGGEIRDWIGGNYERGFTVNPHWRADFVKIPVHPTTRGVEPFAMYDEWYFNMKFQPRMKGVTPILSAKPSLGVLIRKDGPHGGNPTVRASVKRGDQQHVAWAYERPGGGRGFGFTGGHYDHSFADKNFRRVLLNAVAWVGGVEIPAGGLPVGRLTEADLEANQDYPREPGWEAEHGRILIGEADPVFLGVAGKGGLDIKVALKPRDNPSVFLVTSKKSGWSDAWFGGPSGQEAPLDDEAVFKAIPGKNLLLYRTPKGATSFRARELEPGAKYMVFLAPPARRYLGR